MQINHVLTRILVLTNFSNDKKKSIFWGMDCQTLE